MKDELYFQGAIFAWDLRDGDMNGRIDILELSASIFKPDSKESMKVYILNKVCYSPEFRGSTLPKVLQSKNYLIGIDLLYSGIYDAYLSKAVESILGKVVLKLGVKAPVDKLIAKGCEKVFAEALMNQVKSGNPNISSR